MWASLSPGQLTHKINHHSIYIIFLKHKGFHQIEVGKEWQGQTDKGPELSWRN